jgi:hypothetical protein
MQRPHRAGGIPPARRQIAEFAQFSLIDVHAAMLLRPSDRFPGSACGKKKAPPRRGFVQQLRA